MELESVTLRLPRPLLSGAQRVATAREVTIGHMVRQLLKREVDRQLCASDEARIDTRLIEAVRTLVEGDFEQANGWDDLGQRLGDHGYEICHDGSDSSLRKPDCGTFVCTLADLGLSYDALIKAFGAPMSLRAPPERAVGVMPSGLLDPTKTSAITGHFAAAKSWQDLTDRLSSDQLELRWLGAALGVYASSTGRHLCNSYDVGFAYDALVMAYGGHFGPVATLPEAGIARPALMSTG